MAWSGVHDSAALLQRDMLAEYAGHDSFEERMLEPGLRKRASREWPGRGSKSQTGLFRRAAQ